MKTKSGFYTIEEVKEAISSGQIQDVTVIMPTLSHPLTKVYTAKYFLENVLENGFCFTKIFLHCNINNLLTDNDLIKTDPWIDIEMSIDKNSFRLNSWINNKSNNILCMANVEEYLDLYPRTILQEAISKISEKHNISFKASSELEFYTLNKPVDEIIKSYPEIDLDKYRVNNRISDYCTGTINDRWEDVRTKMKEKLEQCGIEVESIFSENGPGMHEVNIRYQDVLLNCDNHICLKQCIKKISSDEGQTVSFMAKTFIDRDGSSCHFHISAYDLTSGENIFGVSDDPNQNISIDDLKIRKNMYYFIGGLIKYVQELFLLYAPTINSYKRYKKYTFTPMIINSWSLESRFTNVRIVGKGKNMRIEFRAAGADTNPYLSLSAILLSGMKGVEEKICPTPIDKGDINKNTKIHHLLAPNNIYEAALFFQKSEFVTEAFGDEFKKLIFSYAQREWEEYNNHISNFEINRYISLV